MEITIPARLAEDIMHSLDQSLLSVREHLASGNWVMADRMALITQHKIERLEEFLAQTCDGYEKSPRG